MPKTNGTYSKQKKKKYTILSIEVHNILYQFLHSSQ